MARYQVMFWKHIPSQVKAWEGTAEARAMLPDRFQAAIDAYSMGEGSTAMDDYLEGWAWGPEMERPGIPEDVAVAVVVELDSALPRSRMLNPGPASPGLEPLTAALACTRWEIGARIERTLAAGEPPHPAGEWSLRDVAAHLEATERECFEPRIHAIVESDRPAFAAYANGGRDFSAVDAAEALSAWADTRARLLAYVDALGPEQRSRTGRHDEFGSVSVDGYLEVALEHDRSHLADLRAGAGLSD